MQDIIIDCEVLQKKYRYVTLSSLLHVRKSVEGFRIAVMALANSSCTVRVVTDVYGSVLNTNCIREPCQFPSTNIKYRQSVVIYGMTILPSHMISGNAPTLLHGTGQQCGS